MNFDLVKKKKTKVCQSALSIFLKRENLYLTCCIVVPWLVCLEKEAKKSAVQWGGTKERTKKQKLLHCYDRQIGRAS